MYNRISGAEGEVVDSLVIKVETTQTDEFHRAKQFCNDGDEYIVALKDAGIAMSLIGEYYQTLGYSFFKIYPKEWNRHYVKSVLTIEYISKMIEEAKTRKNTIEANKTKIKTR